MRIIARIVGDRKAAGFTAGARGSESDADRAARTRRQITRVRAGCSGCVDRELARYAQAMQHEMSRAILRISDRNAMRGAGGFRHHRAEAH